MDRLEGGNDSVYMYAVVVDAALPYHTKENNKYIVTLKVIDHTYHSRGQEERDSYKALNCIFHAKRLEDCPQINHIGDIIRIHRGSVKDYSGKKQMHVNVYFNASWVLFSS